MDGAVDLDRVVLDRLQQQQAYLARLQLHHGARVATKIGVLSLVFAGAGTTYAVLAVEDDFARGLFVGEAAALGATGVGGLVIGHVLRRRAAAVLPRGPTPEE